MPHSQSAGQPNSSARTAERLSTAVHSAENRALNTLARSAASWDREYHGRRSINLKSHAGISGS